MKSKRSVVVALSIVAFLGSASRLTPSGVKANVLDQPASHAAAQTKPVEAYGKLPLAFEANQGQSDPKVRFLTRGSGYALFLTGDSAVLMLQAQRNNHWKGEERTAKANAKPISKRPPSFQSPVSTSQMSGTGDGPRSRETMLWMTVEGKNANPRPRVEGLEELAGKSNYFIGSDPNKWRANVPNYAAVKYENIYPGIDLVYYGSHGQLEYDFVVQPGADPSRILLDISTKTMSVENSRRADLHIAQNGDLVIGAKGSEVIFEKPMVYQPTANYEPGTKHKQVIEGRYLLVGTHQVGFQVAAYNRSKPLVIDPTLVYSSYLGGNNWDKANGIAVDASGNAYVTGKTVSVDFPVTKGAFQTSIGGRVSDAFVTKLNSSGSALVYSTYLGGSNSGEGYGIAVDTSGSAYVTGWTASSNFPTTAGALQTTFGGGYDDAFVSKLNATGSALVYSTYLGGNSYDEGHGIAVDDSGDAYVTGLSYSENYPIIKGAFQSALHGYEDAFVSKLNPNGSALLYSTYLGGNSYDEGRGVAIDASGNAYVTGFTYSYYFPTSRQAFRTTWSGGFDAFVSKLNASGSTLLYSTYLGGSGDDYGYAIALDASNNAYVAGRTYSADFPTTAGSFQTTLGGPSGGGHDDAFVVKLNASGTALVYSTFLGGSCDDAAYGIAVDASGNASVTGDTCSSDFPTTAGSLQATLGGFDDAFFSKLNSAGSGLIYSTYIGGASLDASCAVALDSSGNAYLAGWTSSSNFPTSSNVFQTSLPGSQSAFVALISAQ